jgi:putative ABC transport system permease protein
MSELARISHWEGVERVEPGLLIPMELERGGKCYTTLTLGLRPDDELYGLYDPAGAKVRPPRVGLVIGPTVREKLGATIGDVIRARVPRQPPEVQRWHDLRVVGYVQQPVGSLVYMSGDELRRRFGRDLDLPPNGVTGAIMKVSPQHMAYVRHRLYDLTGTAQVETTADTRGQIEELMKLFYAYIGIMLVFGIALSVAILFNTATISVLERSREFASLRSLGMSVGQVGVIVTVENAVTAVAGSLLGMLLGRSLDIYMVSVYASEQLKLSPVIYPRSYAVTVGATFAALMIAQLPALRTVARLDLAKATKEFVS